MWHTTPRADKKTAQLAAFRVTWAPVVRWSGRRQTHPDAGRADMPATSMDDAGAAPIPAAEGSTEPLQ
jgi:hypothetical protein